MKVRSLLTIVCLLSVFCVGLVPSARAAVCAKGKPVVTDPKGDADPPYTAEPQLDLTKGEITYDKRIKGLVFTMRLADLSNEPPSIATGEWMRFLLTFRGVVYHIAMLGDERLDGAKRFEIGISDGTLYEPLSTLKGRYDIAKNLLSWQLPFKAFKGATGRAIGPGTKFTAIQAQARANYVVPGVGAASRPADSGLAKCDYVIPK